MDHWAVGSRRGAEGLRQRARERKVGDESVPWEERARGSASLAMGLRGAGGRYAGGLLSGRAKRADAAWEWRAGQGGRRAERASVGCSHGCWRGRKCASARGAGEGLVGGTDGRLAGDARASGGGPSAEEA